MWTKSDEIVRRSGEWPKDNHSGDPFSEPGFLNADRMYVAAALSPLCSPDGSAVLGRGWRSLIASRPRCSAEHGCGLSLDVSRPCRDGLTSRLGLALGRILNVSVSELSVSSRSRPRRSRRSSRVSDHSVSSKCRGAVLNVSSPMLIRPVFLSCNQLLLNSTICIPGISLFCQR